MIESNREYTQQILSSYHKENKHGRLLIYIRIGYQGYGIVNWQHSFKWNLKVSLLVCALIRRSIFLLNISN